MELSFSRSTNPLFNPRVALIQTSLPMPTSEVDGKFGALTERAVKAFQTTKGLSETGGVDKVTGEQLSLPFWTRETRRTLQPPFRDPQFEDNHEFRFRSLTEGCYFSAQPERFISGNALTKRALRANNPGALNISSWQKKLSGYCGKTPPDSAGNETTIYESPEEGIAAWYELIVFRYEKMFGLISGGTGRTINLERLARTDGLGKPDGALSSSEKSVVAVYTAGWNKWSKHTNSKSVLLPETEIDPNSIEEITVLGRAMFCHELGDFSPLTDDQISQGIEIAKLVVPNVPEVSTEDTNEERLNIEVRGRAILEILDLGDNALDGDELLATEELESWKTTLKVAEPEEESSFGADTLPRIEARARRPAISRADVRWVADRRNNPDSWHLPQTARERTFQLSSQLIERAIELNRFAPPDSPHGKLVIAIRGARFADGGTSVIDRTSVSLVEQSPDHGTFRCLIGAVQRTSGKISLFLASTVPNKGGVVNYHNFRNGHRSEFLANMLPTGCYEYCVGTHQGSQTVRGVLRLGNGPGPDKASRATVLRTENDGIYGTQDDWDACIPKDNIHPAFGLNSFSSLGCLTVRGTPNSGEWIAFRKAAGFNENNQGTRFDVILLSGMEFAVIADAMGSEQAKKLVCLRHGSKGELVGKLQAKLGFPVPKQDRDFGAFTKRRLTEVQREKLNGLATGTYNLEMDRLLGFGLFGS